MRRYSFLEREVQSCADHVALVGLTAKVDVVEHRAAQVLAELRGDSGSGEDAVAVGVRGFVAEGRAIAAVEAGVDRARVVQELVLPEHPHLGDEGDFLVQVPCVGDPATERAAQAVGVLLAEREVEALGSAFREAADAGIGILRANDWAECELSVFPVAL